MENLFYSALLGLYLFQIVFVGKEEAHAKAVFFPLRLLFYSSFLSADQQKRKI